MSKTYDYVLAVWLRLESTSPIEQLTKELQEYLEAEYIVHNFHAVEKSENDCADELEYSFQIQISFEESQMDDDEPTSETVEEFDTELETYLEAKYVVNYLEVMDDALTSYLLNVSEDGE